MEFTKEKCIARLNEIVEHTPKCKYDYEIVANDWAKNGKNRTYFAIVEKSIDIKISNHYAKKSYGYFDNVSGVYFPDKYGDVRDNFDFGGNRW